MTRVNPFVQRRGGALFFRIAVPDDLRPGLGISEITRTLKTSNASVAAPYALELAARVKRAYWDLRQHMRFDSDNLAKLMQEFREKLKLDEVKAEHETEILELLREHREAIKRARLEGQSEALQRAIQARHEATPPSTLAGTAPGPASAPLPPRPAGVVPSFGVVVRAFLAGFDQRRSGPMFKKHSAVLPLLLEVVGDKPVTDVRQNDINRFFDVVGKLPPRWPDLCRKSKIGAMELSQRGHVETLAPKTFDDTYKAAVRAFLKVAKRDFQDQGFPVNLTTEGIQYKGDRKPNEDRQRAFTDAELKRLLLGPELASFRADPALEHRFWLPHVGLFTGARVNEICQLNPTCDVARDQRTGIWYFQFVEDTDTDERVTKRIKNAMSIRKVPVHRRLIELGFLGYLERQRDARHKLIFPAWSPSRGRASYAAEKWFRQLLREIGLRDVTPGAKLVGMHAFRHTLLSRAYNAQPPIDVTPITGHADVDASAVVAGYRGELGLEAKRAVLESVNFAI